MYNIKFKELPKRAGFRDFRIYKGRFLTCFEKKVGRAARDPGARGG